MTIAKVIFVDDEPNILQGLRRMLHGVRDEWDMRFAVGGKEALAMIASEPVDAVVSDMRMPGMDGSEFLSEVAVRYPDTIRFVLSGEADREMTYNVVQPSHQFLAKPCDKDQIVSKLRRLIELRSTLEAEESHLGRSWIATLPSAPSIVEDLKRAFEAPNPSIEKIASLFEQDAGLCARALQLANSHYFGVGQSVASPHSAVVLLGTEILQPLIKEHGLAVLIQDQSVAKIYEETWQRSNRAGHLARHIGTDLGLDRASIALAQTAALLHLTGRAYLIACRPDLYAGIESSADEDRLPDMDRDHPLLSVYLAALWGMPDELITLLRNSRIPSASSATDDKTLAAVHAAVALAKARYIPGAIDELERFLDILYLHRCGIADRLPDWADFSRNDTGAEPAA